MNLPYTLSIYRMPHRSATKGNKLGRRRSVEWLVRVPRSHPVGLLSPGWSREGAGLRGEIQSHAQLWERNVDAGNTVVPDTIRHVTADWIIPNHLGIKHNGGLIQHISKYKAFNHFSLRIETWDTLYVLSLSCKRYTYVETSCTLFVHMLPVYSLQISLV